MDIEGEIAAWKKLVDKHVDAFYEEELARRDYTSSFYRKVHAELSDYSMRGKRLRSMLLIIGYAGSVTTFTEEDLKKLMPACVAMELMHSHLLIHDDIVDQDDFRRAGSSMHRRIEAIVPRGAVTERDFAIVAGDLVRAHAAKAFAETDFPSERLIASRKLISEVMIETNIGKLYDLLDINQSIDRIEFEHILFVMTYRTSRYTIFLPLAVGAMLAGSQVDPERFEEFSNMLGTAFHLYHDLSHMDDSESSQIRRDIRENKKTVLLKWLYETVSEDDQRWLSGLMGTKVSTADYHKVITLLKSNGITKRAQGYISELLTAAEAEIEDLGLNEKGQAYLLYIMSALAGQERHA